MNKDNVRYEVTVVLPVYNESQKIGSVINELKGRFPEFEILVVDDGSTDGSGEIAFDAGARVVLHSYNRGNGAAIKTGIRNAQGRLLVFMDGDGQHDPDDILRLLEYADTYDMVVGARDFSIHGSRHRSWANRFYCGLASYLTDQNVLDLTSGFRVIRRELALSFAYLLPNTFSYPTTITLSLYKAGYGIKYVPINLHPRVGRSKIKLLKDGTGFLGIMMKIIMLFSPMKVFLPLGMLFFAPGLTYTILRLSQGHRLSNPMVLSLSVSVLIFALGLIAEQIALLRLSRIDEGPAVLEHETSHLGAKQDSGYKLNQNG